MKRSSKYKSVLATVIPNRGFDFSLDYEVNNALGQVQYSRSRQEEAGSPERVALLREATIKTFRQTISIDSENVAGALRPRASPMPNSPETPARRSRPTTFDDLSRPRPWIERSC